MTSAELKRAVSGTTTDEVFVTLITIGHSSFTEPIRVCDNGENLLSNGETFEAYPFRAPRPDEDKDQLPRPRIQIDNVSPDIIAEIRAADPTEQPTVTAEIVLASTPSIIERGPYELKLLRVRHDKLEIEGDLGDEDLENEPVVGFSFTPNDFPGLFQ